MLGIYIDIHHGQAWKRKLGFNTDYNKNKPAILHKLKYFFKFNFSFFFNDFLLLLKMQVHH